MSTRKTYKAIGLMSGTSLDGIDAALIETDGYGYVRPLAFTGMEYSCDVRSKIRTCLGEISCARDDIEKAEHFMTLEHVRVVENLLTQTNMRPSDIDLIGFHGQTIMHNPKEGISVQIGDNDLLARETQINVVGDFRSADIQAGGQGAPFLPLYHKARIEAQGIKTPVVILNIGGVSNITWVGPMDLIAFDTGPGNALIDDFVSARAGMKYDDGGKIALRGRADLDMVQRWMSHPYFSTPAPKSLDRDMWDVQEAHTLKFESGVSTLSAFTVASIMRAAEMLPNKNVRWLVSGGGRYNEYLMGYLRGSLSGSIEPVESIGWNGDALEAEGFGYLAVRSLLGEPLSLPTTTGVPTPQKGGQLFKIA